MALFWHKTYIRRTCYSGKEEMPVNPFEMSPRKNHDMIVDWSTLWAKPYNKHEVDPYTRTRVILMNGTEFENVWFSHQFNRHTADNDLRRQLALLRRSEQQQQKLLSHLKPAEQLLQTVLLCFIRKTTWKKKQR